MEKNRNRIAINFPFFSLFGESGGSSHRDTREIIDEGPVQAMIAGDRKPFKDVQIHKTWLTTLFFSSVLRNSPTPTPPLKKRKKIQQGQQQKDF